MRKSCVGAAFCHHAELHGRIDTDAETSASWDAELVVLSIPAADVLF
jgi:hypothetical protein